MDMSQFLLTDLDVYTEGFVSSFGWVVASLFQLREPQVRVSKHHGAMELSMS